MRHRDRTIGHGLKRFLGDQPRQGIANGSGRYAIGVGKRADHERVA
jgi:hypothetical protein